MLYLVSLVSGGLLQEVTAFRTLEGALEVFRRIVGELGPDDELFLHGCPIDPPDPGELLYSVAFGEDAYADPERLAEDLQEVQDGERPRGEPRPPSDFCPGVGF